MFRVVRILRRVISGGQITSHGLFGEPFGSNTGPWILCKAACGACLAYDKDAFRGFFHVLRTSDALVDREALLATEEKDCSIVSSLPWRGEIGILCLHLKTMHIIVQQIPQSPLIPSRLSFASCPIQSGRRQELPLLACSSSSAKQEPRSAACTICFPL
jgi:hypothetical protein